MKNTISNLNNDILRLKIIRDLKINKYFFRNTDKYSDLLKLVFNNYNGAIHKIKSTDIDDEHLNFIKKVVDLHNIKIVDKPIFSRFKLDKKDNCLKNYMYSVQDEICDTLKKIKNNENDLFFIYKISNDRMRYYQSKNELFISNRKLKLSNLS